MVEELKSPLRDYKSISFWDKFSSIYIKQIEPYNSPITLQLALHAGADKAKSVLEVACGSGVGSLAIRTILQPGTVYFCSDLSKSMLENLKERYYNSDFITNPKNSFELHLEEPATKVFPESIKKSGITLKAYKADNENLPFVDSSFDTYIASGSLYLVSSPEKMVKESYRVLKPGGKAAFSVVGKYEKSTFFSLPIGILEKYAAKYKVELPKYTAPFELSKDETKLLNMIKEAGFSSVKSWHAELANFMSTEEYMWEGGLIMNEGLNLFPEDVRGIIKAEFEHEVKTRFTEGNEISALDFIIIIAQKHA